jgi:hypothetical protein
MRAVNRRTTDTIIDEITKAIAKKRAGTDVSTGDPYADEADAAARALDVRSTVTILGNLDSLKRPLWGYRGENREATEALRTQLKGLQTALKAVPAAALFLLFDTRGKEPVDAVPSPERVEIVHTRIRQFAETLAYLAARCDELSAQRPGKHKLAGYREDMAVVEAFRLIWRRGLLPTNSSSSTSLLRTVASLLFETMTGVQGVDLERACKNIFADEGALARASAQGIPVGEGPYQIEDLQGEEELITK